MSVAEVAEETGTTVLRLPPRELGTLRIVGICVLAAAGIYGVIWWAILGQFGPNARAADVGDFVIPMILASIGLVIFLFSFVKSFTEVRLGNALVYIAEWIGPFHWERQCRITSIRQLVIRHLFVETRTESAPPPQPNDLAVIVVECFGRPDLRFGHAYSRKQLVEFAEEFAAQCGKAAESKLNITPPIEVVEADEATLFQELETQPFESNTVCEHHADGVTLVVAPDAPRKIWSRAAVATLPLLVLIAFRVWNIVAAWPNPDWFEMVAIGISAAVICVLLLLAHYRSKRLSVLAVVGDQLLVNVAGLFRGKRHELDRGELYDIRSGAASPGAKENERFELQVWKRDGTKIALLSGREEMELRWMATRLRQALRLPAKQ